MSLNPYESYDQHDSSKHDIARRFMALPLAARKTFLQALAQKGVDFSRLPIVHAPQDGAVPLSFAQQRLWFFDQMSPGNTAFHIPAMLALTGQLDRAALQASLDALVARHAELRTTFSAGNEGQAEQVVHPPAPVLIAETDLSALAPAQRFRQAERLAEEATLQPFDLTTGPLLRVQLLRLTETEHRLLLIQHHIISDGWSVALLLRELAICYRAFCAGENPVLPALAIQYSDYALWQRHWLEAGERERQLDWWRGTLGDEHPLLALPTDRPRPADRDMHGDRHPFVLGPGLSADLHALAQRRGVTLFMLLLAAFQLMLGRLSGQADIRVGVSIAGRTRRETEGVAGLFVNIQVMRATLDGAQRFEDFLEQVKAAALGAQGHQDLPFDMLVDGLQVERSLSHNPLVQVKFTQQIAVPQTVLLPGLTMQLMPLPDYAARFDLSLDVTDTAQGIEAVLSYATALFDVARVAGFAEAYTDLLSEIVAAPDMPLAGLGLPTRQADFSLCGEALAMDGLNVLDAWAQSVAMHPDAAALQYEDAFEDELTTHNPHCISFAELDAASNRLARYLQAQGVGAEQRVAVCAARSPEFVLGLLAVLKAGGAYLPIDPTLPSERIAFLLADAKVQCALGDVDGVIALDATGTAAIALADDGVWSDCDAAPLRCRPDPLAAAYLIYTSGSTGRPKGVVVSHGALADYVCGMLSRLALAPDASMAMVSTVVADLGHTVLFGALCSGRLLHLISADRATDPDYFAAYMKTHQVGVLKIVASHLQGLLQAANPADVLPRHALILGGEALPWGLCETVHEWRPDCRVMNHYGPTEATVGVLTNEVFFSNSCYENGVNVPIGAPLPNAQSWVLDLDLNPVPLGSVGELYLGGPGLARGYAGQAGLTAERFVPLPFADGAGGERLYRSGDRVRLLPGGVFEFLGRVDDQVKIRGYRIELSEVAQALRVLPEVAAAEVVAAAVGGDVSRHQLVGYLVPVVGRVLDIVAIKALLARRLPDYMVPTHLLVLERMPYTTNGKLDRKALPAIGEVGRVVTDVVMSANECVLAEIWRLVLGVSTVGLNDNFFALGGDSILSLQIIARARKQGLKLTPKQLFEHQTVAALARVATVLVLPTTVAPPAVAAALPGDGVICLTPVQEHFFTLDIGNRHHWNQALRFTVAEPLDPVLLRRALVAVVRLHAALRCRYERAPDGDWQARMAADDAVSDALWLHSVVDDAGLDALCDKAQKSLSIRSGRLLCTVLAQHPDGAQTVFMAIHHLAVDGVSWRILLDDIGTAYRQLADGRALDLPVPESTGAAWAGRLADYAYSDALAVELPYWLRLADYSGAVLPQDMQGASSRVADAGQVVLTLDRDLTRRLLKDAPAAYRTHVNDLLLTALARVVGRFSGTSEVLVELEGHGREALFEEIDLSRTVGWFASHFPVLLAGGADDAGAAICAVKETLRGVPNKGIGFGVLKSLASPAVRTQIAALPIPRVTFNYLGQFDASADDDALLRPLFGQSGAERDGSGPLSNWLAIHGQVAAGELSLTWVFSREMYRPETMQRLAEAYRVELTALIDHCCAAVSGGVTPSDFPLAALNAAEVMRLPAAAREVEDIYPATPLQQGLLFHALYAPQEVSYVNQLSMTLTDPDADRLAAAWQAALDKHAILRTGFWHDGVAKPQQIVHRAARLVMAREDWRGKNDQTAALVALCTSEHRQPFDLTHPPLMRLALVRLTESQYRLIWTRHHLLLDGWSTARLWAEVLQHYAHAPVSPASRSSYRDYIAWLTGQDIAASRGFWERCLAGVDTPTLLAGAFSEHAANAATGYGTLTLAWSCADTARLQHFARDTRVTFNTLMQGAWSLLLQHYTGKSSVVFGTTVAGRPADLVDVEQVLGLFINTLPVVATPQSGLSVEAWLRVLQADNLALREHEHTPLFEIQRWAGSGGQALFDSLIVFENYPVAREWSEQDENSLRFSELVNVEATTYALTLVVNNAETLSVDYGFDRALLDADAVRQVHAHFVMLINELAQDGQRPLGRVLMPSQLEQRELTLTAVSATNVDARADAIASDSDAPMTQTEQKIAAIWGDVLGVAAIGRSDNFFALGGHSLLAMQVMSRLRSEFQISVPLRRLFDVATLAGFAQTVEQAGDKALNASKLDALDALLGEMEGL
ncbi:amino acid adenylation domain-containing protein [Glaciimonas sp. GG7]